MAVLVFAGGDIPVGIYLESERISSMVPKAFEEKYIRLYSRFIDGSDTEHCSIVTEEDNKLIKPVLRSAFFAWAKQEENDARLVEPPTPARMSCSDMWVPGHEGATAGKMVPHRLSPMVEDTVKRDRTPAKDRACSPRARSDAGESNVGDTNAAKKRLKLK